jgi:hypothetical protein
LISRAACGAWRTASTMSSGPILAAISTSTTPPRSSTSSSPSSLVFIHLFNYVFNLYTFIDLYIYCGLFYS